MTGVQKSRSNLTDLIGSRVRFDSETQGDSLGPPYPMWSRHCEYRLPG